VVQKVFEDTMLDGLQYGNTVTDALEEAQAKAIDMRNKVIAVRLQKTSSDQLVISAAKGGTLSDAELEQVVTSLAQGLEQ
jgi:hypothetical protein